MSERIEITNDGNTQVLEVETSPIQIDVNDTPVVSVEVSSAQEMVEVTDTGVPVIVEVFESDVQQVEVYSLVNITTGSANRAFDVLPIEVANGVRIDFTSPSSFVADSMVVYLNGLRESHVSYPSGLIVRFETAPYTGDDIRLDFNF